MKIFILILFNFLFIKNLLSQQLGWEKVLLNEQEEGSICSFLKSNTKSSYLIVNKGSVGNGTLGWFFFQMNISNLLKIDNVNGETLNSSHFNYNNKNFIIDIDTIFTDHLEQNKFKLLKVYNGIIYDSLLFDSELVLGEIWITDSSLNVIAISKLTKDHHFFSLNRNLGINHHYIIPYSQLDSIAVLNQFYGDIFNSDISKLYYNNISKKYWLSNHLFQFILNVNLEPIGIIQSHTKNTSNLFDQSVNNYYDVNCFGKNAIQLQNHDLISICQERRFYYGGPYYGNTIYTVRLTKWNENFEIKDSIELSYDSIRKSFPIMSANSPISYKNNPNEIYVCYSYDSSMSSLGKSMVIVAKVDSSLNLHWQKAFQYPGLRFASWGIEALEEGGAIIYGGISENPTNPPSPIFAAGYIIRIDSSGTITSTSDPLMQIEKDYVMYPNPAKDYVWFQVQKPYQTISIRIYDIHGKLVYQKEDVQEERINISEWSKGMYLYQIECEGRISSGKILKE